MFWILQAIGGKHWMRFKRVTGNNIITFNFTGRFYFLKLEN